MIQAIELRKEFSRRIDKRKKEDFFAVDGISMSAKAGEIVGILGANGAGKTTLLRMLAGLMEPTGGEVLLLDENGEKIENVIERKKRIGYLSENTKLYGRLSVREMLKLCGSIYNMTQEAMDARTDELVEVLEMQKFIDNRIESLSTGQKQRSSIARCLMHDPEIYIFDEPTLGLDVMAGKAIIDFMKQERERGKCVLYSTHYMEEAQNLCDRMIMIDSGQIIAEGTADQLMEKSNTGNLRDAFFFFAKEDSVG